MATLNQVAAVTKKLGSYGYRDVETALIESNIDAAIQSVFNFCNINTLPMELDHVVVNMACGEVMHCMSFADDNISDESSQAVASIKEGDTQVNFVSEATPAQRKDMLIQSLRTLPYVELIAFRRLRW